LVYLPVHSRLGVRAIRRNIYSAVLAGLLALSAHAAEPKKGWQRLDSCRYLADKNNDGDSFLVQCGRERFYARFYFVDAPEAHAHIAPQLQDQYDYFGVTLDELTRAGGRARDRVQAILGSRPFVIHTKHASAQGRAKTIRYYSLVEVDGRYLHEVLLSEGLARNKGVRVALPTGHPGKSYAAALQQLEDQARLGRRGIWAASDPSRRKSPL
jgi:endonuclease YncB( thermonuclease family)